VLVVTRKRNEAIIIGDGIEVRVLRHGRDGVRLGITAPLHVAVHRQEVYETIRAANTSAASDAMRVQDLVARLRSQIEKS
jgi:carbon storage regulator